MKRDSLSPIGIIMAVTAIIALASTKIQAVVHLVLLLICIASYFVSFRIKIKKNIYTILRISLLLPFIIWLILFGAKEERLFYANAFYSTGLYFFLIILIEAFKTRENNDYISIAVLSMLIMISSGFSPNRFYPYLILLESIILGLYCIENEHLKHSFGRNKKYWIKISLSLFLICAMIYCLAKIFIWSETKVNSLITFAMPPLSFSSAFKDRTNLHSIDGLKGSNKVILRVSSTASPGNRSLYMAGKAYHRYYNNTWESSGKTSIISPLPSNITKNLKNQLPNCNTFYLARSFDIENVNKALGRITETQNIFLSSLNSETLFAGRNSLFAILCSDSISIDEGGIIYSNIKKAGSEYCLLLGANCQSNITLSSDELEPYLLLSDKLPENIIKLNDKFSGKNDTSMNIANNILSYLRKNYRYGYGSTTTYKGKDVLENFLIYSREGHCEFFATSMALLLRLNRIPSRYINGFLVEEYNRMGKYYIAREKDAHAWVEAYFPGKGWVAFDPTPPGAVAPYNKDDILKPIREMLDSLEHGICRLKGKLAIGGFNGAALYLLNSLKLLIIWIFSSCARIGLLITALAILLIYLNIKVLLIKGRHLIKLGKKKEISPEMKSMNEILIMYEKALFWARLGKRTPQTTLIEYINEIDKKRDEKISVSPETMKKIDDFTLDYCRFRFGNEPPTQKDLCDLREKLNIIRNSIKQR